MKFALIRDFVIRTALGGWGDDFTCPELAEGELRVWK